MILKASELGEKMVLIHLYYVFNYYSSVTGMMRQNTTKIIAMTIIIMWEVCASSCLLQLSHLVHGPLANMSQHHSGQGF